MCDVGGSGAGRWMDVSSATAGATLTAGATYQERNATVAGGGKAGVHRGCGKWIFSKGI